MANLYATITYDHHAGYTSRTGHRRIKTTAETWGAVVTVEVDRGGDCRILLTDKRLEHARILWEGNIDRENEKRGLLKLTL